MASTHAEVREKGGKEEKGLGAWRITELGVLRAGTETGLSLGVGLCVGGIKVL